MHEHRVLRCDREQCAAAFDVAAQCSGGGTVRSFFLFTDDSELLLLAVSLHQFNYVILQKILAVLAVVWLCAVFLTVSVSTVRAVSWRRVLAEKQARHYLKRIEKNHRRHSNGRFHG